MKKIIVFLLVFCLLLTGCSAGATATEKTKLEKPASTAQTLPVQEETQPATEAPTQAPAQTEPAATQPAEKEETEKSSEKSTASSAKKENTAAKTTTTSKSTTTTKTTTTKKTTTSKKTSKSTCKDTGSKKIWTSPDNPKDYYEEKDEKREAYLQYLKKYGNPYFFYLEENTMRMYTGKTYGMPLITSEDIMLASTWTSSNPEVATVSSLGFVKPLKVGNTVITVTYIDPEVGEVNTRKCSVRVEMVPTYTIAQLEQQAKEEAKQIANYVMKESGCTTDLERIALAAALINTYVAKGNGSSRYAIENGELVSKQITGYNQPYGTLITFYSSCAGDTRALGMVLEYMGFKWYHVNEDSWTHQWCMVYDVDGKTAFADGSQFGIAGYGERKDDQSNWVQYKNGKLVSFK